MKIVHFRPMEDIRHIADAEFEKRKQQLLELMPYADVQHVGSTSIPGALTKGDLDIQVRVAEGEFEAAKALLRKYFRPNHEYEIWSESFASFEDYDNIDIPLGIQLTIKDSVYDEFHLVRELFRSSPELLERYNELKRSVDGRPYSEYRKRTRDFFGPNGSNRLFKIT